MINKDFFEGPVGDYCIARNTIKCLLILESINSSLVVLVYVDNYDRSISVHH